MKTQKIALSLAALALIATASAQLKIGDKAPELQGGPWINSAKSVTLSGLRGRVVLVFFWTFECINCKHNLPVYKRIEARFRSQGVEFISIHSPETKEERSTKNVTSAVIREGIDYPVLQDNQGKNWDAFHQRYWPALYVIDQRGTVRGVWEGELNFNGSNGERDVERLIDRLISKR